MKESGIGRENGVEAFESCGAISKETISFPLTLDPDSQSKSVIVNIASSTETRQTDDWFAEDAEGRRYG